MDVIESNEAFAASGIRASPRTELPYRQDQPERRRHRLGFIGATGAILTVKTMYELKRTGGRYGLITMCIGGGQGIAMIIERMGFS